MDMLCEQYMHRPFANPPSLAIGHQLTTSTLQAASKFCCCLQLGYIPLVALQRSFTGSYPAKRHTTDAWSRALVGFHIMTGSTVIYGGAFCWFTTQMMDWAITQPAINIISIASILHGVSNFAMLRKVPGFRMLTVPFYIMVSANNVQHGWMLYSNGSEAELLLVWNMVGTYIYVRYFIFLLGPLIGWDSWLDERNYDIIYTLSLPLAAIYGVLLPTIALGHTLSSAALFACPVVLGPIIVVLHRGLQKLQAAQSSSKPGLACNIPAVAIEGLLQATNPNEYHGKDVQVQ